MKISKNHSVKAEKRILLRRIAPCEAARRFFDDKKKYVEQLSTFVKEGLTAGDKVIVVATALHLKELENQLRSEGIDIFSLSVYEQYVPMDAENLLDKFMVKWWPDAVLFRYLVATLAARMLKTDKNLRIYSEMASLLWLKGHTAASAQLEIIWNKLIETQTEYTQVKLTSEILPAPADHQDQPPVASFLN